MSKDPVLARWSRRKQAAALAAEPDPNVNPDPGAQAVADAPNAKAAVAPPPDLPDVEALTADSDYTPFMQAGVPEDVKRLALRKLWRSNPIFANLDGMNDYDEDFGVLYKIGAAIQTSYQIGRGMPDPFPEDAPGDEAADPVAEVQGPVRPSAAASGEGAPQRAELEPQQADSTLKRADISDQDRHINGDQTAV